MLAWWAAGKDELRALLADKGVLLILIGGTLFYAFFYPLPYRDQVARDVPVVIVDLDRSAASRHLIRMLGATEQIAVTNVLSEAARGQAWLRSGKAGGIIEIPAGFERRILRGETVRVGIWGNAAYVLVYSQVANGASMAAGQFSAQLMVERLGGTGVTGDLVIAQVMPVQLALHELFNPAGGYGSYVVPAVLVLILQQTLLIAIGMMGAGQALQQRQWHSGRPSAVALFGRALPYLGIHLVLALVILTVVYRLYAFPSFAFVLASLLILLPFLVATIAFGFLLTSCFGSRETALQVLVLLSMPTLFLAGFVWPAEAMPAPLVAVGWVLPSTAAIDAFVRFHQMGATFTEVAGSWFWLWGMAVIYFTASVLIARHTVNEIFTGHQR